MATAKKTEDTTKAVPRLGPYPTKIGSEELLELLDLWQFTPETKRQITELVKADRQLQGPHLFRYYNPRPSKVEAAEKAMGELIGVEALPGGQFLHLGADLRVSGVGNRGRRRGDRAGLHVLRHGRHGRRRQRHSRHRGRRRYALSRSGGGREGDHASGPRPSCRSTCAAPRPQMDAILDVARRKGLPVVEDVAQAGGGSFQGKRLGSLGTLGCFSFDYYKVHASGEGGFVTTNDEWLYTRAQSWHDTAACWRPDRFGRERKAGELFCGENYRMSELQGAVALAQIRKTDAMLAGYRRAHRRIKEAIEPVAGLTFRRVPDAVGRHVHLPDPVPQGRRDHAEGDARHAGRGRSRRRHLRPEGPRLAHLRLLGSHSGEEARRRRRAALERRAGRRTAPLLRKTCARARSICLSRAIMIDINWHYSDEDCDNIALGINRALKEVS